MNVIDWMVLRHHSYNVNKNYIVDLVLSIFTEVSVADLLADCVKYGHSCEHIAITFKDVDFFLILLKADLNMIGTKFLAPPTLTLILTLCIFNQPSFFSFFFVSFIFEAGRILLSNIVHFKRPEFIHMHLEKVGVCDELFILL